MTHAILRVDRHGIVQRWDAEAERLFGFQRTEIIGRSIELIIPVQQRDRH